MARSGAALAAQRDVVTRNSRAIRRVLHSLLIVSDGVMLALAFLLGYIARARLPLPALPVNPPSFTSYIPMMIVHVASVLVVFYFARMYHMRRMASRFDEGYAIAVVLHHLDDARQRTDRAGQDRDCAAARAARLVPG